LAIAHPIPEMHTSEFDYTLPEGKIALHPLAERDGSKLLFAQPVLISGELDAEPSYHITHHQFSQIGSILPERAVLVVNNTRVIEARLKMLSMKGGPLELFLLDPVDMTPSQALAQTGQSTWNCLIGGKKKWPNDHLAYLDADGEISLEARWYNYDQNQVTLSWQPDELHLAQILQKVGVMPLPPYLNRKAVSTDSERYQTVFASEPGAVAAPTASLHFTPALLAKLAEDAHPTLELTLHVSAGTFKPMAQGEVAAHAIHSERYFLPLATLKNLAEAADAQNPLCAVGTTALRTLETLYWRGASILLASSDLPHLPQELPYQLLMEGNLPTLSQAYLALYNFTLEAGLSMVEGTTALFIYPGYKFQTATALITNFHQPGSTLIALVATWLGPSWRSIYAQALENDYRFLSYGDSCLFLR
jgi:S-adenosylmethionine:tRNA ribosyltransferase-isomerase